ncbi:ACP S-malonyltransferase [Amycolatopsis nigrescens]|uniref:ACP S-malonyltransferase n=1 Tax=Amycolatopsis nigrescens TaxID=381445 RepID=UPI0003715831|nr:ACP S-malonyltransferase [Amycolatopsis nigrescens]
MSEESTVDTSDTAAGLAIAFPGQGNKPDATVEALTRYREHPLVAAFLRRSGLADPADLDLRDTRMAQPATYVCGLASVSERFGADAAPAAVLGHSLGELTALAQAGVLDPWDGLALAERRGQICHAQQDARPGSMIAVMGTGLDGIEWIRRQAIARSGGVLELAGLNGRRQTVLSGDTGTAREAVAIAGELEVLAEELPIGGSFHSPLMADAIGPWREAVTAVPFKPAATTVVSTIDAAPHTDPEELRELLIRALLLPVRWLDATKGVRDLGIERVWDAGPGETLHKLGRREHIVKFVRLPALPQLEVQR